MKAWGTLPTTNQAPSLIAASARERRRSWRKLAFAKMSSGLPPPGPALLSAVVAADVNAVSRLLASRAVPMRDVKDRSHPNAPTVVHLAASLCGSHQSESRLRYQLSKEYIKLVPEGWSFSPWAEVPRRGPEQQARGTSDCDFRATLSCDGARVLASILQYEGPQCLTYTDDEGLTPVHWAAFSGCQSCLEYIEQAAAEESDQSGLLDAPDALGRSPAFWALAGGNEQVLDWLLQRGAQPDRKVSFFIAHSAF